MESEPDSLAATAAPGLGWSGDQTETCLPTPRADPGPRARPDRVGRFVILDELGSGGMGVVYAAWDPALDRRVALKLVRPDRGRDDAHGRLLREAQAMAKLAHPNVVAVYEVGSHHGAVWIAMEYVDGATLRGWLASEPPRARAEILAVFRQAGEGLAAAHAVGLVHRDFKPDNVLIGAGDGRPRVADFGLVRPVEGAVASMDAIPAAQPSSSATDGARLPESGRSTGPLTEVGALVGTPRYMAPEQFRGLTVDARTDQFAFCVALYEALYGQPPFRGRRVLELAAAVTAGEPEPPPRDSPIPARVGRAILRGLARDPGDRFPDMHALLAELRFDPRPRRWPVALASLAVAGSLGVGVAGLRDDAGAPVDPCAAGRAQIAADYGDAQRDALARRFEAVAPRYAGASLAAVDKGLRRWADGWSAAYAGACTTRHEQSAGLYDQRMACLRQRRQQLVGTVTLLRGADAELVRDAPELIAGLPSLDACADLEALAEVAAPPVEQAEAVAAVREALAGVTAQVEAGRYPAAAADLAPLLTRAESLGYAPLDAELAVIDGRVHAGLGDHAGALAAYLRGYELALASGDDRQALTAAIALIAGDGEGVGPAQLQLSRRWQLSAAALARRLGDPVDAEVARRSGFARALMYQLQVDEAVAEIEAAATLAERQLGADSLVTARAELAAAEMLGEAGRYAEANRYLGRAVEVYERELSPDHPLLIRPLTTRSGLLRTAGQLDAAWVDAHRASTLAEANYGPAHESTISAMLAGAVVLDLQGEHAAALSMFERVLERLGELEAIRTDEGVSAGNSACFIRYKLRDYAGARAQCQRVLVGGERLLGAEHPILALVLNNLALIARAEADPALGLDYDQRALQIVEGTLGPEHNYVAYALVGIGEGLLALGRAREAVEPLTRAVRIRSLAGDPGELGEAECLLGRALGGRAGRASAHAGQAKLREAGKNWQAQLDGCTAQVDG